jgi:hypothetical protein
VQQSCANGLTFFGRVSDFLMKRLVMLLVLVSGMILITQAHADDRHAGYYYPPANQIEIYKSKVQVLPDANAIRRIGFVTAITHENLKRPYPPTTTFFAKGDHAQKLIIVASTDGILDTIYRVRAYLASLTAVARTTNAFRDSQYQGILNFFDLAHMLGFEQITISDGDGFTHQVIFE